MPRSLPRLPVICLGVTIAAAWLGHVPTAAPKPQSEPQPISAEESAGANAALSAHAPAGPAAADPANHANQLIDAAIRTLENRFSVEARFRQSGEIYGHKFFGSGTYTDIQPGRNHKYRLEIKLRAGDRDTSLIQVCDGRYLWLYRALPDGESLDRVDVASVVNALRDADNLPQPEFVGAWPGLGGLPRLLRGLYHSFHFTQVETDEFQAKDSAGGTHPVPLWKLTGRWRPERLVFAIPSQKQKILAGEPVDLSALPEHVPDEVVVYLGQTTLFPLRIEYRRKAFEGAKPGDCRYLLVMDWVEVNLNVPVDPNRFLYHPGQLEVNDATQQFLNTLDLKQRQ